MTIQQLRNIVLVCAVEQEVKLFFRLVLERMIQIISLSGIVFELIIDKLTFFPELLSCGKRPPLGRRVRRIVGGVKSRPGEWPWQVSLRLNGTQWCAGAILSEYFVLSAAHCFGRSSFCTALIKHSLIVSLRLSFL